MNNARRMAELGLFRKAMDYAGTNVSSIARNHDAVTMMWMNDAKADIAMLLERIDVLGDAVDRLEAEQIEWLHVAKQLGYGPYADVSDDVMLSAFAESGILTPHAIKTMRNILKKGVSDLEEHFYVLAPSYDDARDHLWFNMLIHPGHPMIRITTSLQRMVEKNNVRVLYADPHQKVTKEEMKEYWRMADELNWKPWDVEDFRRAIR